MNTNSSTEVRQAAELMALHTRIEALEAALEHIEALCFEATSYGHTDINRVLSVVARAALEDQHRKKAALDKDAGK